MIETLNEITQQIEAGRLEEAEKSLEAAVDTEENRCDLLYLRGYLQECRYDREAALATYQTVLDLEPDHEEAVFRSAFLCDLGGDDDTAIELYRRCAQRRPARVEALVNLAVLYEDHGSLPDAEACLKGVLAEHPNHWRARHFLRSVQAAFRMVYDEKVQREHDQRSAVLDQPITDFELSVRSRNCLRQMNIRTLGDLLRITEAELLSYKNFGDTSLNEIKAMLTQKNLRLGQSLQSAAELPVSPSPGEPAAETQGLLNQPASELELSVRARKCLQRLGITTLADLTMRSEAELMATKNFGQTSLTEIQRQLRAQGLSLREPG